MIRVVFSVSFQEAQEINEKKRALTIYNSGFPVAHGAMNQVSNFQSKVFWWSA